MTRSPSAAVVTEVDVVANPGELAIVELFCASNGKAAMPEYSQTVTTMVSETLGVQVIDVSVPLLNLYHRYAPLPSTTDGPADQVLPPTAPMVTVASELADTTSRLPAVGFTQPSPDPTVSLAALTPLAILWTAAHPIDQP
jgi:hypothetical protein